MKKYVLILLFIVSAQINYAQEPKYSEHYNNYLIANEKGDYDKALEEINLCISYYSLLENTKDTNYAIYIGELAGVYANTGQYDKAIPLQETLVDIFVKYFGKDNHYVAERKHYLAYYFLKTDQTLKAISIYEQVLKLYIKSNGKNNSYVAQCYYDIAFAYDQLGEYNDALPYCIKALDIYKITLGVTHSEFAKCLSLIITLYDNLGKLDVSLSYELQYLDFEKQTLGEYHPDVAVSYNDCALLYTMLGRYDQATILYEKAIQVLDTNHIEKDINYAVSLGYLAFLYSELGQFERAILLYNKSLLIIEELSGENNEYYVVFLNGLSSVYLYEDELELSLSLIRKSIKIVEEKFGLESSYYAMSLNNLSLYYKVIGQFEKAFQLCDQALDILNNLSIEDQLYIKIIGNLGSLYADLEDYNNAIDYTEKSIYLAEKQLGFNNPLSLKFRMSLSNIYSLMDNDKHALKLLRKDINDTKRKLGLINPTMADLFNNLGKIHFNLYHFKKSERNFEKALSLYRQIYRQDHSKIAFSLFNLSLVNLIDENFKNAIYFQEEAIKINNHQLINLLPSLTENQKVDCLKLTQYFYEYYDYLLIEFSNSIRQNKINSINNSILWGNVTLRSNELMRKSILKSNDTILINNFENWIEFKKEFANAQSMSIKEQKNKGIDLKTLEDSIETKERLLTISSKIFQTEQEKLQLNYEAVKSHLAADEAFVMFHSFDCYNCNSSYDSDLYAAYVVRSNQNEPILVRLFEQAQLDSLMLVDDLTSMMGKLYQPSDSALYNLVWKPIAEYLGDAKKVFIAPSGQLHKLAFAAIGDGTGHILSDKYEIHQVLSAHDFVYPSSPVVFNGDDKSKTTSIALFGGINYDQSKTSESEKDSLLFSPVSLLTKDLKRGNSFEYLPGTKKEIEIIQRQFKQNNKTILSYSGLEATEASLRSLEGDKAPKILHIATHGYFLPDIKEYSSKDRLSASNNPLIRSGLMMAGSNASWKGTVTLPGEEDGILTAQEVSNLNLLKTQLVVLSACETGLGDIKGREGVFGLQRAFRLAGAKYLLLSLWSIPDEETSEYMQLFYAEVLKQNDISKAYKSTQSSMRQKYPNSPMNWAGMVLVE
jgi:CHAT domain-containing protein